MSIPSIEPGERGHLAPSQMRIDPNNPRFALTKEEGEPSELEEIAQLLQMADLEELVQSIAANSYIDIEPLIVLRENDHYLVVEGNRRLAAVKLLLNPDWAEDLDVRLPEVTEPVKVSMQMLSVLAVASREEARQYIGFKHINGPHKWDSYSKAHFAAQWYLRERENGITLRDIARSLGDRHDTVRRLVHGIFVLTQAEETQTYELSNRFEGRAFAFSHLYTALTRPGYREFLGLSPNWRQGDPDPSPVPPDRLPNLRKVLVWLYGAKNEGTPPVVTSQNPHIKQLSEVLENRIALAQLEVTNDLGEAFSEVDTPERKFTDALISAYRSAEKAQKNAYDIDQVDASVQEIARRLVRASQSILKHVEAASIDTSAADR